MDAHVFRRVCDALIPLLTGSRLEKIQSPTPDVFVFSCYAQQRKQHLILRAARHAPFLYIASDRPVSGAPPAAFIMRLRKYCMGRRVAACGADWSQRRLALLFHTQTESTGALLPPQTWLILDLRQGPQLLLGKAPEYPPEPLWPPTDSLDEAAEIWRQWPVLTPALRRVLPLLEPLEKAALLKDLQAGGGDLFVYGQGEAAELSAWPLPEPLRGERDERVLEQPLEAAALLGGEHVLGAAVAKKRAGAAALLLRESQRLERILHKLREEETRLRSMADAQAQARALRGVLWRTAPDARQESIDTDDVSCPRVPLDIRLTVRENMEALFHKAARGQRGLVHMATRRETLETQCAALRQCAEAVAQGAPTADEATVSAFGKAGKSRGQLPQIRGVQTFRSSDGFMILRGKDAKGNAALLRAAAAHDLWLHVEGGPGAHALVRCSYAGQEVPQRTLYEAAVLAALKSWQKDSPSALILCAQARHVKPLHGATPGTVRVDKVAQTFRVAPDATLEMTLVTGSCGHSDHSQHVP